MKEIASLKSGVQELQRYKNIIWVGAVSFEERCTGSLAALSSVGLHVDKGILIEYPTQAKPPNSDLKKRRVHRSRMNAYLRGLGSEIISASLHPYRLGSFNYLLSEFNKDVCMIVDISCLTKAHTIALAFCVVRMLGRNLRTLIISYTRPKEYGNGYGSPGTYKMKHGRWADTVSAPFAFGPQLVSEEANGVILLGHEGPRIALSLRELPPKEAIVVLASTPGQEHLQIVTRTVNAELLREAKRHGWPIVEIDYFDMVKVQKAVHQFTTKSGGQKRRVVLYPFGPKSLIFGAAFEALDSYQSKIWYSYPIPDLYDVDYSHGIGAIQWFLVGQHGATNE